MASDGHRHVLVVEDETLIALDLEALLEDAGYEVTCCATVSDALSALRTDEFDAAILDLNVHGEHADVVADALEKSHVPFVVCSGHSSEVLPERHSHRPFVTKPYDSAQLLATLQGIFLIGAPKGTTVN